MAKRGTAKHTSSAKGVAQLYSCFLGVGVPVVVVTGWLLRSIGSSRKQFCSWLHECIENMQDMATPFGSTKKPTHNN